MIVLIDNGHGVDTPGKRSPKWDGVKRCFEWEFNRDLAKRLSSMLTMTAICNILIVPEDIDIPLRERTDRINNIAENADCMSISIHGNAYKPNKASGWEAFTTPKVTNSDRLANYFYEEAELCLGRIMPIRKDMTDGDPDKEANLHMVREPECISLLTENGFFDNLKDCHFMMSDVGRTIFAMIHYNAIVRYMRDNKKF